MRRTPPSDLERKFQVASPSNHHDPSSGEGRGGSRPSTYPTPPCLQVGGGIKGRPGRPLGLFPPHGVGEPGQVEPGEDEKGYRPQDGPGVREKEAEDDQGQAEAHEDPSRYPVGDLPGPGARQGPGGANAQDPVLGDLGQVIAEEEEEEPRGYPEPPQGQAARGPAQGGVDQVEEAELEKAKAPANHRYQGGPTPPGPPPGGVQGGPDLQEPHHQELDHGYEEELVLGAPAVHLAQGVPVGGNPVGEDPEGEEGSAPADRQSQDCGQGFHGDLLLSAP
ncbi:hypothetical protein TthTF24_21660 (plasmid) [Thermus thermophilus]